MNPGIAAEQQQVATSAFIRREIFLIPEAH
jgi:hypothetical protein